MLSDVAISVVMLPVYMGWFACLALPLLLLIGLPMLMLSLWVGASQSSVQQQGTKRMVRGDPEVLGVTVKEDGSPLVDFATLFPELVVEGSGSPQTVVRGRVLVGSKLCEAQLLLKSGLHLRVLSCFRSDLLEDLYLEDCLDRYRAKNPDYTLEGLSHERARLNEQYLQSGYKTGGAFDVTLVTDEGVELNLGARHDQAMDEIEEESEEVKTPEVVANRQLLSDVLKKVGFVRSPNEWWHWSYGDRFWSASTPGSTYAIYGDLVVA